MRERERNDKKEKKRKGKKRKGKEEREKSYVKGVEDDEGDGRHARSIRELPL